MIALRRRLAAALLIAGALLAAACAPAPEPPVELTVEPLVSGVEASLRGLSVVDGSVAWASGSDGQVGVTVDGGRSWRFRRVAGHESRDFRDVEGLSADRALLLAVGSPGLLLESTDGGATWLERHRDARPEVFLDGLDCEGEICVAFGDPIGGRFLLLLSEDSGRSWRELRGPAALPGEAAFAASGRSIRMAAGAPWGVALGTGGGSRPRLLISRDGGATFRAAQPPLAAGAPSRGLFALAARDDGEWVVVGGDFRDEGASAGSAARSEESGASFCPAGEPPGGYRSAVERLGPGLFVATGPTGTDLSTDGGVRWRTLSNEGFHVVAAAPDGSLALAAGAGGRIARLTVARIR